MELDVVNFVMNVLKGYPTLMLWVPFMAFAIGVIVGRADEQHEQYEEAIRRILARRNK